MLVLLTTAAVLLPPRCAVIYVPVDYLKAKTQYPKLVIVLEREGPLGEGVFVCRAGRYSILIAVTVI